MNTHFSRSPMARCISMAQTVESTPPETAITARPSPMRSRSAAISPSMKRSGDHTAAQPQTFSAKLERIRAPSGSLDSG